jgi:hypothetical protein
MPSKKQELRFMRDVGFLYRTYLDVDNALNIADNLKVW